MSSTLQSQREKRYSHVAVKAKYDRARRRVPDGIYIFLEGLLDKAVYYSAVAQHFPEKIITPILCDGKTGVLNAKSYVNSKPDTQPITMFFIDRDLDELIGKMNIEDKYVYITDGYSIENDFVRQDVLRYIIEHVFHAELSQSQISSILRGFADQLAAFESLMLPLMAWTITLKSMGCNVRLDNARLERLFVVASINEVRRRPGALNTFRGHCDPNVSLRFKHSIRPAIRLLRTIEGRNFVRGKYALWFFLKYIDELKAHFRSLCPAGERAVFLDAHLDENNIVQIVVGKVASPDSLKRFLDYVAMQRALSDSTPPSEKQTKNAFWSAIAYYFRQLTTLSK